MGSERLCHCRPGRVPCPHSALSWFRPSPSSLDFLLCYPHTLPLLFLSLSPCSSPYTTLHPSTSPGPHSPTHERPFRPSDYFKGSREAPRAPAHQIKLQLAAYMQTDCVWMRGLCWHTEQISRNTWLRLEEQEPQRQLRAGDRGRLVTSSIQVQLQRALPGCEVPYPCLQQGCA